MPFQLVYYSQQDPKWKSDLLGFGDPGDTIGYVGCALSSVAMLLSGHGFAETPKSLNEKLKGVGGFAGAGIRWSAVTQLYPQVTLQSFIPCATSDAPLAQIDAALAAGQPAIVMVDNSPAAGLQTHWMLLYARKGDDYLMLDPWPYQTDVTKETLLMPRYSQGRALQRSIMHVILYQNAAADGIIALPDGSNTTPPPPAPSGSLARVKAEVVWGLNVRSSIDTSSPANILEVAPAGTQLTLLEADGWNRVGAVNQWVRVRTPAGKEGYAAAWYLEKVLPAPVPTPPPVPEPESVPPTPQPEPQPEPVPTPGDDTPTRLRVVVKSSAKVYDRASTRGKVVSRQAAGAVLSCIETPDVARPKVGVKGQWLNVRYATAKRGYIQAELVELK
ncbi:MAG: SH3 domain-containing protein [Chloroflexi bacterium]|nr:SH3 domain-containing protein [Chloroflexota bacterium]